VTDELDDYLWPLDLDRREQLYRLADEARGYHERCHFGAFEECRQLVCRQAWVVSKP
jgi:hypothetical protein